MNFFNPWLLWSEFAMKSAEMWLASGQVIGTRVNRMARAGHNPSPRDRKEFMLMGTEKVRAATESGMAMAAAMTRLWQPWWSGAGALSRLSTGMAQMASAGLRPVHSAATANARRLGGTRGRSRRGRSA